MATKKRIPWAAMVWTGAAGALLFRTFYHPSRAVVADGYAARCAGKPNGACVPTMLIGSFEGAGPVYTPVGGRVLRVGQTDSRSGSAPQNVIEVAAAHEPIVLQYRGPLQPQIQAGEEVGPGQQIALASEVEFGVKELRWTASGVEEVQLEPASWLAARGLRISVKKHKADTQGPNWCEGGRTLRVPESAALCNLQLPAPGGFMLLPVSVTVERGV